MEKILVSAEELAQHLNDPSWVIFDTRHELADTGRGRRSYEAGHIPGAYFLHVDDDLSGPRTGQNGRHPLPDLAAYAAKIDERGVKPGTQVVVYDDMNGNFAVRLWWMLRWLGHGKVALLDGGWPHWERGKYPVTKEVPALRKGNFTAKPHLGATVDAPFLERFREDPSVVLLDARAPDRFNGLQETIDPVAGHIPGARNHPFGGNLDADGRFLAPEELARRWHQTLSGADPGSVVAMCGSGVTACHNMFAMALAGMPEGRLYPGSWSEWIADRSRPVFTRP